jgi:hypothetical protein
MSSLERRSERPRDGSERRAHPRAVCDGSITIQLDDGAHRARLRDVSRAGICFFLDRPIAEMTVLSVRIELPARGGRAPERIESRGVVVRCLPLSKAVDHYEIALFLNELGEPQRERLDAFVAATS